MQSDERLEQPHEQAAAEQPQPPATSAGIPTERLGVPPAMPAPSSSTPPAPTAAPTEKNQEALVGLGLIALGFLALLGQVVTIGGIDWSGGLVLLTIASCFLFFAFWKHIYGLMIPGSILAGLSIGVTFADISNGISVLWGLALGFLAILLLGRTLFKVDNSWPLYPAIPLFAVGVIVAIDALPGIFSIGLVWLPLLLIGAGLYLGWGRHSHG
jgi:hypothetical protein